MKTRDPHCEHTLRSLVMAVHLFMLSQTWLLKFVTETSSTLSDTQKKALLGQIECARGVLEVVRKKLDESPLPEQTPPFPEV
jgi:hypothetical protein